MRIYWNFDYMLQKPVDIHSKVEVIVWTKLSTVLSQTSSHTFSRLNFLTLLFGPLYFMAFKDLIGVKVDPNIS